MDAFQARRFFSSMTQVERRISSESPIKERRGKRKSRLDKNPGHSLENSDDSFSQAGESSLKGNGESFCYALEVSNCREATSQIAENLKIARKNVSTIAREQASCPSSESAFLSQGSEYNSESQIMACGAKAFASETFWSTCSEAAAEFLSFGNSSAFDSVSLEDCQEEPLEEFPAFADEGRELGGFDDIVELCAALNLKNEFYPEKSEVSSDFAEEEMTATEFQEAARYSAVVTEAMGPKGAPEVKALDAWIHYFYKDKKEPFRLAHLLLAKSFLESGEKILQFPDTVEYFLKRAPSQSG